MAATAIKFKSEDRFTSLISPTAYHQCDLVLQIQSGHTKLHLPLVLAAAASPRLAHLLQGQQDKEQACVILPDYCHHTLASLSDLLTTGSTNSLNLKHTVELEEICTLLGFGQFPRRQHGAVKKIVDVAALAQAVPKTSDAEVSTNNLDQVETLVILPTVSQSYSISINQPPILTTQALAALEEKVYEEYEEYQRSIVEQHSVANHVENIHMPGSYQCVSRNAKNVPLKRRHKGTVLTPMVPSTETVFRSTRSRTLRSAAVKVRKQYEATFAGQKQNVVIRFQHRQSGITGKKFSSSRGGGNVLTSMKPPPIMMPKKRVKTLPEVKIEQDLNCDLCEHRPSFSNVQNLTRHVKSKHEGIRHNCDQCNYAATQASSLKRHKLTKHS